MMWAHSPLWKGSTWKTRIQSFSMSLLLVTSQYPGRRRWLRQESMASWMCGVVEAQCLMISGVSLSWRLQNLPPVPYHKCFYIKRTLSPFLNALRLSWCLDFKRFRNDHKDDAISCYHEFINKNGHQSSILTSINLLIWALNRWKKRNLCFALMSNTYATTLFNVQFCLVRTWLLCFW